MYNILYGRVVYFNYGVASSPGVRYTDTESLRDGSDERGGTVRITYIWNPKTKISG